MHAPSTIHRHQVHAVWLAAIAVVILGIVIAVVAVTVARDDPQPASAGVSDVRSAIESKTNDNFRFAEMNALPEAVAVRPMTDQQLRFLEINQLPDASLASPVAFERMRFIEVNALPDDGALLIAPTSDRPGERY